MLEALDRLFFVLFARARRRYSEGSVTEAWQHAMYALSGYLMSIALGLVSIVMLVGSAAVMRPYTVDKRTLQLVSIG